MYDLAELEKAHSYCLAACVTAVQYLVKPSGHSVYRYVLYR